jgi:hypothetical protein
MVTLIAAHVSLRHEYFQVLILLVSKDIFILIRLKLLCLLYLWESPFKPPQLLVFICFTPSHRKLGILPLDVLKTM